jgi:hypothetical protein
MLDFFVMWRETIVHDMTLHLIPAKDPLYSHQCEESDEKI